jgi:8-oxo-dGTP diphosphatase
MTDWQNVPSFGEHTWSGAMVIRPSAYGLIADDRGRLAVVHTPSGVYLPGGGSSEAEAPEETVIREVQEECGLIVQLGSWRRTAVERLFSTTEQTHFEKRCTFCDGYAVGESEHPSEADHTLEWLRNADAATRVTPLSHRWAIVEWLATRRLSDP